MTADINETGERYARLRETVERKGKSVRWLVLTHDNPDPDALASALILGRVIRGVLKHQVTLAFGGIVGLRDVSVGTYLTPGTPIVDLVAVDGDPLVDVTVLERPAVVVKGGRVVLDARVSGIVSLGEPFRTGAYPGVYVPYVLRIGGAAGEAGDGGAGDGGAGDVIEKRHNLALRNDNPQHRWVFDGGF